MALLLHFFKKQTAWRENLLLLNVSASWTMEAPQWAPEGSLRLRLQHVLWQSGFALLCKTPSQYLPAISTFPPTFLWIYILKLRTKKGSWNSDGNFDTTVAVTKNYSHFQSAAFEKILEKQKGRLFYFLFFTKPLNLQLNNGQILRNKHKLNWLNNFLKYKKKWRSLKTFKKQKCFLEKAYFEKNCSET